MKCIFFQINRYNFAYGNKTFAKIVWQYIMNISPKRPWYYDHCIYLPPEFGKITQWQMKDKISKYDADEKLWIKLWYDGNYQPNEKFLHDMNWNNIYLNGIVANF